jgi:aminopeptidase N
LASGKDVTNLMDNWVKEMGYPVVSIEETNEIGKFKVLYYYYYYYYDYDYDYYHL